MGTIDLSYLEDITGGESDIMIEMIDLMLNETPKHLANLKKAFDKQDWDGLGSEAHKLKPMFLYIGLTGLNEVAQKLEFFGKKEENLEEIPELIEDLEAGFSEVIIQLKEKKQELS
jgi:HPt (histidine-containing phosphotransfer) domain-containing protein